MRQQLWFKLITLCGLVILGEAIYAQNSVLELVDDYGQYAVGFQTIYTHDASRSFGGQRGKASWRPIQACIWYPAQPSSKPKMQYAEYFFLKASETGEVVLTDAVKQATVDEFLATDPVDSTVLEREFSVPMIAQLNAKPDGTQRFPVIVYGPSWWSSAFENALLCEWLASHGYVVVASPSMGPVTREMPISRIGVETQARDMEFLLGMMYDFPNADIEQVAVAGFSLGGLSNVLMLARHTGIDAWIGLDATVHEAYDFFEASPYEDYTRYSVPMLFVNSLGFMETLPFYNRLVYSDAYLVNLPKLEHTDLASQFIKLFGSNDDPEQVAKRVKGYRLICHYVLQFLDGVFKKDFDYEKMISTVFNRQVIDTSFLEIKSKKALPNGITLFERYKKQTGKGIIDFLNHTLSASGQSPYPEKDLQQLIYLSLTHSFSVTAEQLMRWYGKYYQNTFHLAILAHHDYPELMEMFQSIYQHNRACYFDYYQLNHTGHILSMSGEGEAALRYFKLNTLLRPENYQAFFNLGIGYFRLQDFTRAKQNFKKCLNLQPDERYSNLAKEFLSKCK